MVLAAASVPVVELLVVVVALVAVVVLPGAAEASVVVAAVASAVVSPAVEVVASLVAEVVASLAVVAVEVPAAVASVVVGEILLAEHCISLRRLGELGAFAGIFPFLVHPATSAASGCRDCRIYPVKKLSCSIYSMFSS